MIKRKFRVVSKIWETGDVYYWPQYRFLFIWWAFGGWAFGSDEVKFDELGEACAFVAQKEAFERKRVNAWKEKKHLHNKVQKCCK